MRAERAQITASPPGPVRATLPDCRRRLIINGEADVLRDDGEAYASKPLLAGVDVTAVRIRATIHDFVMLNALDQTNACRARDGFGCKLAGKKVIKEDTGEKEEIKMVFLDGQIMDFADNIEAVKQIKKKIVKTLSGGSLDPEIVIQAADRLVADIMSGRSYMADGEWPAISRDYPPASLPGISRQIL